MKTNLMIFLLVAMLPGCRENQESLIREEAIREIAENSGKAEAERFLNDSLTLAQVQVERYRLAVSRAADARALALAEDDLREARREVSKIETELQALDKKDD
jgi:hypothetical protein